MNKEHIIFLIFLLILIFLLVFINYKNKKESFVDIGSNGEILNPFDNPDQSGILKINISFLGNSCNGFQGSGNLISVQMESFQLPMNNLSLIKINHNSSFRDLNNNEINISNINVSEPHISRIIFP